MMKKILSVAALLALSLAILLAGCAEKNLQNQTNNQTVVNETNNQPETKVQSLYDFCVNNSGQVLGTYPAQCVLNGILYFNETDNAMMLFTCTSYYDGCNMCSVENNSVSACTLMYCEPPNTGTPKCTEFNETLREGTPKQVSANFWCDDNVELSVIFDNVLHVANLSVGGSTIELPRVVSADGGKYSNLKITFFGKGSEAVVYDAKDETKLLYKNCTLG